VDFKQIKELIALFENTDLHELEVEQEGLRVRLQKPQPFFTTAQMAMPQVAPQALSSGGNEPAAEEDPAGGHPTINAPMVGTFYAAPAPGEPAFIKEGDKVDAGATVCIVEAMKLMNEVVAKFACEIVKVLVENGQPVEYGQPLFAVRPLESA
jgi:acetyl-CoA carboxylase biotin carboxyl carrier protein